MSVNQDYNDRMLSKKTLIIVVFLLVLAVFLGPAGEARASEQKAEPALVGNVSRYDMILAMNTLRVANGLPPLIEDPIVNAVAQTTAEIMAANLSSWHIGDVRGRIAAAGYGGGATVWATENFAVGKTMTIDQIMVVWADPDHMRPAVNPAYCHVGAGVAQAANGSIYYVLQAAYTSGNACGDYVSPAIDPPADGTPVSYVPQIIIPVSLATPDADGKVYHDVKQGQTFWAIAVAYQVTIADIEFWNNLSRDQSLYPGMKLFIPDKSTEGFATPTPVGMVELVQPDAEGKIVHIVQPYQTLIGISTAYNVSLDRVLVLNGLSADWPLRVEQSLLINPGNITPSPTPQPLTPLEKLTPASDGNYYHKVRSGESLTFIAGLYDVPLVELLAWNGLTASSIIQPDQSLLLQVTPPVEPTSTPVPATEEPAAAVDLPTATPSATATAMSTEPSGEAEVEPAESEAGFGWLFGVGLAIVGVLFLVGMVTRRRAPDIGE